MLFTEQHAVSEPAAKRSLVRATLSAHALILQHHPDLGEQVLMVRLSYQDHRHGKWSFPGGFVDEGETIDTALQREVMEEIGLQLVTWQQVQVLPCLCGVRPHVGFVYRCHQWQGEPCILSNELSEISWFNRQQFHQAITERTLAYPEMARQVACLGWETEEIGQ